jgi:dTDP-4-dehydrorhamnose reductase
MKVLVTGALGIVGRTILAGKPSGCEVEILLDPETRQLAGYPWYRSDITDYRKTEMAITCSEPDWVIHCAGMSNPDACELDPDRAFRVNTEGAGNIARAARTAGSKMVMLSTEHVYDGHSGPYKEDDRPEPVNVFGQTKLDGEKAAASENEHLLVIRIGPSFGKRFDDVTPPYLSDVFGQLRRGEAVTVPDDQFTTPAYLPELAAVIWLLIERNEEGIWHFGSSDRLSIQDMAVRMCRNFGVSESLVTGIATAFLGLAAPRPLQGGFITEKIRGFLARPTLSFDTALLRMTETGEFA